jgi:hypothetical protein
MIRYSWRLVRFLASAGNKRAGLLDLSQNSIYQQNSSRKNFLVLRTKKTQQQTLRLRLMAVRTVACCC